MLKCAYSSPLFLYKKGERIKMLEVYSVSQTFSDGVAIPLNNISISKGCTAVLAAPATIELNKCGVYMVSCNSTLTGAAAGSARIQMSKNGVAQPQAQAGETLAVTPTSLDFTTLVQVNQNNNTCYCTSPTLLQFIYSGDDATGTINVCVTKIC